MTEQCDSPKPIKPQAYVINEKGEEVPITDLMVEESMKEVKLRSIGAHTGFNKVITDDMLENPED